MPSLSIPAGEVAKHGIVLAAGVVTTVTFAENVQYVEVVGDGTAAVYYTIDKTTPTVAGGNCFILPAGVNAVDRRSSPSGTDTINLISAGTPTVSVQQG